MAEIEKTVLVSYSAEKMFNLVDDVAKYPEFLPWCDGTTVVHLSETVTHATVNINYHHVKHSFSTENKRNPPLLIEMHLLNGPFEHLDGHWRFIPLSDEACKIEFRLHYTFSHKILEKLVGPVFHMIANSFVESFIGRADTVYGG
ncbi:MAG: type II toxin-antitoxin system RatA family toxin [Nitrosomonas sp.]|nr:type II toxin-antitoxin system RatA family toxin [Nitrosomonas sp.]MCP5250583.1 type II toxin-antitoxin system RatA family toxin [Burkholderiales bacterium]MCP5292889.1 type II toxin-antitoxin system RatA family toxin [Burkholderiales bacterium]MDR4519115.1 type II toxin-antitoxin system RatA family toxin [Nitrosomonas sp.]HQU62751.1 type II toxin-antitoxin system RatA family toxin [Nitrosomonas sp.]